MLIDSRTISVVKKLYNKFLQSSSGHKQFDPLKIAIVTDSLSSDLSLFFLFSHLFFFLHLSCLSLFISLLSLLSDLSLLSLISDVSISLLSLISDVSRCSLTPFSLLSDGCLSSLSALRCLSLFSHSFLSALRWLSLSFLNDNDDDSALRSVCRPSSNETLVEKRTTTIYKCESEIDTGLIGSAFKIFLFFDYLSPLSSLLRLLFLSPLQGPLLFLTIVVFIVLPQFIIFLFFLLLVLVVNFLSFLMSSFASLRNRDIRPSIPGMFFSCCFHSWLRLTFLCLEPIISGIILSSSTSLILSSSFFLLTFANFFHQCKDLFDFILPTLIPSLSFLLHFVVRFQVPFFDILVLLHLLHQFCTLHGVLLRHCLADIYHHILGLASWLFLPVVFQLFLSW